MKLTLRYNITKIDKKQKEIIEEIMWHATKVYNMVLYELREEKRKIDVNKSINIIQTEIYKEERKNNWHSKYMHSHTLQQVIINVIQNYKSYIKAKEDYEKRKNKYRGKPKEPRYKQGRKQEIVFTKYAIRKEKNRIKLSISKEIQEKFKSRSINFLIPRRLKKLINFESIKMIKIVKKEEELEMEIIYERKEKEERKGTNIMSIDIGINNIVACTNKENSKSMLVSGREAKSKNKYIQEKNNKSKNIKYFWVTILVLFIIFAGVLFTTFVKSPEYTIYSAISAMKTNNYEKTIKYINIEKIVNNRFEAVTTEMMNDPALDDNPFAGLAYMFVEAVKPKFVSIVQDSFKNIVESPDNIFQEVSTPKLLIFLIIKNYNGITLVKTQNEPKKVIFEFNDNSNINNLQIELNKNSEQNWEIVDIGGYDFWDDANSTYLEHNE